MYYRHWFFYAITVYSTMCVCLQGWRYRRYEVTPFFADDTSSSSCDFDLVHHTNNENTTRLITHYSYTHQFNQENKTGQGWSSMPTTYPPHKVVWPCFKPRRHQSDWIILHWGHHVMPSPGSLWTCGLVRIAVSLLEMSSNARRTEIPPPLGWRKLPGRPR